MRKFKDAEIIFVVYGILTLILGTLVFQYRSALQQGQPGHRSFADRNIEFVTDFYGLRYHGVSDNLIDLHILYFGAFEKPMLHWLRDTVAGIADEDLVFLDVGANTGQHTLFMSQLVSEVHSFEPYPPVLEKLREAVDRNGLTNVSVHPVGLGATSAVLDFFEPPPNNQGTGGFVHNFEERSQATTQLVVEIGDEYLAAKGVERVDIIKIDVEGYEKNVMTGLGRTLIDYRPIVVMELTIDGALPEMFKSQAELIAAFPEDYKFEVMPSPTDAEFESGRYELQPFSLTRPSFLIDRQWTVVAYPIEKSSSISRSGH